MIKQLHMTIITLYKDTSPFLIPNNDDIYLTSSAFASPSAGGAFICTATPSGVISGNISGQLEYTVQYKTIFLFYNAKYNSYRLCNHTHTAVPQVVYN